MRFTSAIPAEEIHGDSWSAKYGHVLWLTPTLGRPVRRGRKGIGETPQGGSPRRLTSRLRKARGVWTADLQEKVALTLNERIRDFIELQTYLAVLGCKS